MNDLHKLRKQDFIEIKPFAPDNKTLMKDAWWNNQGIETP